jgi:hypothetical protein
MRCDTVYFGSELQTFRSNLFLSSSRFKKEAFLWFKMDVVGSSEMLVFVHQTMWCNIPEECSLKTVLNFVNTSCTFNMSQMNGLENWNINGGMFVINCKGTEV